MKHQLYAASDLVYWSHERIMTALAQRNTQESEDVVFRLLRAAITMGYIKPMWG
jgi:hypothetical protein